MAPLSHARCRVPPVAHGAREADSMTAARASQCAVLLPARSAVVHRPAVYTPRDSHRPPQPCLLASVPACRVGPEAGGGSKWATPGVVRRYHCQKRRSEVAEGSR